MTSSVDSVDFKLICLKIQDYDESSLCGFKIR